MPKAAAIVDADTQAVIDSLPQVPVCELAAICKRNWKPVHPFARPYVDALLSMRSVDDPYGADSGREVAIKFLGNAQAWKGPVADAVKDELKKRLKGPRKAR